MLLGGGARGAHEASEIVPPLPRPRFVDETTHLRAEALARAHAQEAPMSAPESDKAGVRQTIRALRNADHVITQVEDGASELHDFAPDASEDDIIEEVMSCDDGYLIVRLPDGKMSHVYFVFGNDPDEVICDHGVSLSPVLDPLMERWGN